MNFSRMVKHLLSKIHGHGYEATFGHAFRCEDCKTGSENSLHKMRLAIDINLFKDGQYLTRTEDYKFFGLYWETLGGSWGGRFLDKEGRPKPDGNHFSLEFGGLK